MSKIINLEKRAAAIKQRLTSLPTESVNQPHNESQQETLIFDKANQVQDEAVSDALDCTTNRCSWVATTKNVSLTEPVLFCILLAIIGATFYIQSVRSETSALVTATATQEPDKKAGQIPPSPAIQIEESQVMIAMTIPADRPIENLEVQEVIKTKPTSDTIIESNNTSRSAELPGPTIEVLNPSLRRARNALGLLEATLEEAANITSHSRSRSAINARFGFSHSS